MKYIITLLFSISFCFSQNQEAKIFFIDGDTFEGFAMITGNNDIKFRLTLDDEPTRFSYDHLSRIEFYGFETSSTFQYVKFTKGYKLLEVLTEGEVTLFAEVKTNLQLFFSNNRTNYGLDTHNMFTLYLAKKTKNNSKLFNQNPFKSSKKKMMEYFSDCSELVRKIKTNEFKSNEIKEIVEYYNDFCTEL